MMIRKNRNVVYVLLLLAAGAVMMLGACSPRSGVDSAAPAIADSATLTSGQWLLESLEGVSVSADAGVTMTFDAEGKVYGYGGCNNYFGSWKLQDDMLVFGPMGSTKRACMNEAMQLEDDFFKSLGTVKYALKGNEGRLLLSPTSEAKADTALVFVAK
ncbi:META domain-containing protein [Oleidesulfovibrio sp.]|uniref:META domain-containing protein n=1 Tax=Oleidesulfovibrio sp. TaxID=2909707 RepID=UPI003A8C2E9F